jgi:alpha-mannosidase
VSFLKLNSNRLKTYEEYFNQQTKHIIDSAVAKLPQLTNMTFMWTEISFLHLWWEQASEYSKNTFKQLVHDNRIEITTGGWVMTDEATSHIYSMLDQLIEGHQWVKSNLNVTPSNSWSIDPFGHGSTLPYLLGTSDFDGAIIQRIHYNWKEVGFFQLNAPA